ncbi:MAG: hypothetical protein ACOYK8_09825 [Alphaproteobacteria bacterium]
MKDIIVRSEEENLARQLEEMTSQTSMAAFDAMLRAIAIDDEDSLSTGLRIKALSVHMDSAARELENTLLRCVEMGHGGV